MESERESMADSAVLTDFQGRSIRLTDERWEHILYRKSAVKPQPSGFGI
jgi:hypothetical protein